jgi:hypothetical protein
VKGPYSDPGHSNLCVTKSVKHLVTHKLQCLPRVLELHVQRHSPEPSVVERGHSRVTHTHAHTGMCASSAGHSKVTHTQSHTHTPGVFACVCVCVCVCVCACACVYMCALTRLIFGGSAISLSTKEKKERIGDTVSHLRVMGPYEVSKLAST